MSPQDRRPRRTSGKKKPNRPAPEPLHPIESPPEIDAFTEWDLGDEVQAAIAAMGITKPTPIQALAIGPGLEGRDIIAKAETGTGKTLAFGAPMISKIDPARRTVLGLVLSPTRELAQQVFEVLQTLGKERGLTANLIVGGEPMGPQVRTLQAGAQVVVGTPGRVLDLMEQGFLSFPWTEFVVLDEADKMLEIGFIDDIKKILRASNEYRQTLLFSATFPTPLLEMAREYTNNPLEVATSSGVATAETVQQYFLPVRGDDRTRELRDLIRSSDEKDVFLVFCDRRTDVDKLMRSLERERFSVKALHGGYDQASRFRVMDAFRTGAVKVLVATDVASRGLDVNHVTVVVNLNAPRDISDYTHRIGRTGRAGREGQAVTFVGGLDQRRWRDIEQALPVKVERLEFPRDMFKDERDERPRRDRGERPNRRDREERRDHPPRD
ncbi:MAG: DEAD/DEAH box helicase, partial [Planctomycetes bacterium]|nr:DEAD/DEAH box helicase [Planctomycetota bacterium]